jgi:hypothetical protein
MDEEARQPLGLPKPDTPVPVIALLLLFDYATQVVSNADGAALKSIDNNC